MKFLLVASLLLTSHFAFAIDVSVDKSVSIFQVDTLNHKTNFTTLAPGATFNIDLQLTPRIVAGVNLYDSIVARAKNKTCDFAKVQIEPCYMVPHILVVPAYIRGEKYFVKLVKSNVRPVSTAFSPSPLRSSESSAEAAWGNCPKCGGEPELPSPLSYAASESTDDLDKIIKAAVAPKPPPPPPKITQTGPLHLAKECYANFMSEAGEVKPLGHELVKQMRRYDLFSKAKGPFSKVCPNFDSFHPAEKEHFLVYFMTELIMREDGCLDGYANLAAVSSTGAWGYFQLNSPWKGERDAQEAEIEKSECSKHAAGACGGDTRPDINADTIKRGKLNIECGIAIFANKTCGKSSPFFTTNQYYQPLQDRYYSSNGRALNERTSWNWAQALSQYKNCFKKEGRK